jgi:glucose dehydrogenase
MFTLRRTLVTGCMLCLFTLPGWSASRGADGDWLTYNRTLAGDRFSPLKEIDRSNVAQLKLHVYAARGVRPSDRSACC